MIITTRIENPANIGIKYIVYIVGGERELADWLRVAPEECREFMYKGGDYIYTSYDYFVNEANIPVYDKLIRRNHGEWQEPLIEE